MAVVMNGHYYFVLDMHSTYMCLTHFFHSLDTC